jgi:hypothetical protein
VYGDRNNFQAGDQYRMQIGSYWGLELRGSRLTSSPPTYVSGLTTDPCVSIIPEVTGNIALLGTAAGLGLVPDAIAQAAADAYREYRRLQHQIRLQGAREARTEPAAQASRRADVAALWQSVFGEPRTVEVQEPCRG